MDGSEAKDEESTKRETTNSNKPSSHVIIEEICTSHEKVEQSTFDITSSSWKGLPNESVTKTEVDKSGSLETEIFQPAAETVEESGNEADESKTFASLKHFEKLVDNDLVFVHDYGRKESSGSDSESDSSASVISLASSSSVSSDNSAVVLLEKPVAISLDQNKFNNKNHNFQPPFKTHGELALEDLPPIEDLHITVPEQDIRHIGKVSSVVQTQVIIQSFENERPLDLDTILFLKDGTALGKIFDVFGRVSAPFYSVRFNSEVDIKEKGIEVSCNVYCAPERKDVTCFVFTEKLLMQKGSDASWKDNNEPPEECLEFSDDEQERVHKMKLKAKRKGVNEDDEVHIIQSSSRSRNKNLDRRNSKAAGSLVRPNRFNAPTPDLNSYTNPQNSFQNQYYAPSLNNYPSEQGQLQQMQNNSQWGGFQQFPNYQNNAAQMGNPFLFGAPPAMFNNPFTANRFMNPIPGSPFYNPLASNANNQPFPDSWGTNSSFGMQFTQPPPQTHGPFTSFQSGPAFGNQIQNSPNQPLPNFFARPPPPPPP